MGLLNPVVKLHEPFSLILAADAFQVSLNLGTGGVVALPLGVILEGKLVCMGRDIASQPRISIKSAQGV